MRDDDGRAVELAAEKRRADAKAQAELDARRAELPRALREDARERWMVFKALARRVLRRLG